MAEAWIAQFLSISFAGVGAQTNIGAVLNLHGTEILKVRRIILLSCRMNNSVGGTDHNIQIRRHTQSDVSGSQTTDIIPSSYDRKNVAPSAARYVAFGTIAGPYEILRNMWFVDGRASISNYGGIDITWENLIPFSVVFDAGYQDPSVQPLTLRTAELVCSWAITPGGGAGGQASTLFEFTRE